MGRRAKKAPVQTKKRVKLSKQFKCPFCANNNAVECKMDMKSMIGSLACRICGASYQMNIHHLHEPIDVFSEWLDDCEAAANPNNQVAPIGLMTEGGDSQQRYHDDDDLDDDDDAIPESSGMSSEKKKSANSGASKEEKQRYTDLGLDDSDDDSDDE